MPAEPARKEDPPWLVLVVDDEEDVRTLVGEILNQAGISTLLARHGQHALDTLDRVPGPVDLVLTDILMPGMDGPTLARRLALDRPALPVLFMTGYPADTLEAQSLLPIGAPRIE